MLRLSPVLQDYNDEIGMAQRQEMGMVGQNGNGAPGGMPPRGRGRGRGVAPGPMRGRGGPAGLLNAPGGRGGAPTR